MIIISIIVGAAVLVISFKPFFGDFSGFWECVKFWIKPEIFSLFRGYLVRDETWDLAPYWWWSRLRDIFTTPENIFIKLKHGPVPLSLISIISQFP